MFITAKHKQKLLKSKHFSLTENGLPEHSASVEFVPKHYNECLFGRFVKGTFYPTRDPNNPDYFPKQESYDGITEVVSWRIRSAEEIAA